MFQKIGRAVKAGQIYYAKISMETSSIIDSGAAQKIVSKYLGGGELVLDLGCGSGKFCGGLENCVGYDLPELDLNKDKIPHPDSKIIRLVYSVS